MLKDKHALISEIEQELASFPGISFNFSQAIQDNVQEAMSGVKGENAVKLYGPDLRQLEALAMEIQRHMEKVRGVKDLGVLHLLGQPNLIIEVDRQECARYGLKVGDVNGVIQAAIGGQSVTQVYEGEKWFDLVVRFLPEYRLNNETIGQILVSTPDGARIPIKQLATITEQTGAFIIYRENNERYIPIKFSVLGRDLEGTVTEAQAVLAEHLSLPEGYHIEWHGEYDQLQDELGLACGHRARDAAAHSLSGLSHAQFHGSMRCWSSSPCRSPLVGGVPSLALTRTHFSISAAVGFISLFGVAVQGALILVSRIRDLLLEGFDIRTAIMKSAEVRMRPVLMTSLAAAIGLIPAAVATGIGAQSQQPLARVVVGGMLTSAALILLVLPILYRLAYRWERERAEGTGIALTRYRKGLPEKRASNG